MSMISTPRFWFFPRLSGDFRLIADPDDPEACRLTIENPTGDDYAVLQPFLATLVALGFVGRASADSQIKAKGHTSIAIKASSRIVAPMLTAAMYNDGEVWTAVRAEGGKVYVNDGVELRPQDPPKIETPVPYKPAPRELSTRPDMGPDVDTSSEEAPALVVTPRDLPAPRVEAAVTVTPPARGCPEATSCERRASQVLTAFSTAAQIASWRSRGWMPVVGNYSGIRYQLFHEDEAAARGFRHTLIAPRREDVPRARAWGGIPPREVCVWNASVPPEEQALSIKLAVEHRERWLLENSRGEIDGVSAAPPVPIGLLPES